MNKTMKRTARNHVMPKDTGRTHCRLAGTKVPAFIVPLSEAVDFSRGELRSVDCQRCRELALAARKAG